MAWEPIPEYPSLSQEEIDANNARIWKTLPKIIPADYQHRAEITRTGEVIEHSQVDRDVLFLLRHLTEFPFLNLSERAKALTFPTGERLNYRELKTLLEKFRSDGFCKPMAARMRIRGANSEFWLLTQTGGKIVGGGLEAKGGGTLDDHIFLQELLADVLLGRGIQAKMEAVL